MTFLKGFRDRSFAGRIFKTEKPTTLEEVMTVAIEKENEARETGSGAQANEAMEIGAGDANN